MTQIQDNDLHKGCWIQVQTGGYGTVKRASKEKNWVDVDFGPWSKRMPYDAVKKVEARTL